VDPEPAIDLSGLGRAYGDRAALHDVSLRLERGATLVVFGPNGAGKTTLLRVLATLLRPTAGTARVLGRELPGEAWAVRGRIGLLAHEPLLYRELTARENLRFHARLHRVVPERGEELLEIVQHEKQPTITKMDADLFMKGDVAPLAEMTERRKERDTQGDE